MSSRIPRHKRWMNWTKTQARSSWNDLVPRVNPWEFIQFQSITRSSWRIDTFERKWKPLGHPTSSNLMSESKDTSDSCWVIFFTILLRVLLCVNVQLVSVYLNLDWHRDALMLWWLHHANSKNNNHITCRSTSGVTHKVCYGKKIVGTTYCRWYRQKKF